MSQNRGRDIPWLSVIRFHKDIVARAEQGFFSINGGNDQDERWTSVKGFDPENMAGPWQIERGLFQSRPFLLTLERDRHESVFMGGPCFLAWSKSMYGKWIPQWRPLLYREVEFRQEDVGIFNILPKQGAWSVTPLLCSILDRLEITIGSTYDEFAANLIEKAASYPQQGTDGPLDQLILKAFISAMPDAATEVKKPVPKDTFSTQPSPWIFFAPTTNFSAMTRYLAQDYERLETLFQNDCSNRGGLCLLEDMPSPKKIKSVEMLPFVPLNESQRRAVQSVLDGKYVTVISGPPGTGKSQVVVSILLNSWAQGKTVLFASNNNKAVDVVRERVEHFEDEFPIAVRAGSKQKQNIQDVLRRVLNMAGEEPAADSMSKFADLKRRRQGMMDELEQLRTVIETGLPQRINEARGAILNAYASYQALLGKIQNIEDALHKELAGKGYTGQSPITVEQAISTTKNWIGRIDGFKQDIFLDEKRRNELLGEITGIEVHRNRIAEEIGLSSDEAGDWKWLMNGPRPEQFVTWKQQLYELISKPVEDFSETIEWKSEYDRWKSLPETEQWLQNAIQFSGMLSNSMSELTPKLEKMRELKRNINDARGILSDLGIPENIQAPIESLLDWSSRFLEITTKESGWLDFLPWSRRSRLRKELCQIETVLRPFLPLAVWTNIGVLNDDSRRKLVPVVESIQRWIDLDRSRKELKDLMEWVVSKFTELRSLAANLELTGIPSQEEIESWRLLHLQCDQLSQIARESAHAWKKRLEKERIKQIFSQTVNEWRQIAGGLPIWESWRRKYGSGIDQAISQLAENPKHQEIMEVRGLLYKGLLDRFLEDWQKVYLLQEQIQRIQIELDKIPESSERVMEWWGQRPSQALVLGGQRSSEWPDLQKPMESLNDLTDWLSRWKEFINITRPVEEKKVLEELKRAISKLGQIVKALPESKERDTLKKLYETIQNKPDDDWPLEELSDLFAAFGPERIKSKMKNIEFKLEKSSFQYAKEQWMERMRRDDDSIRAVHALDKSLQQNRGVIVPKDHPTFRSALRTVPIWITTAQAASAIPLEPALFDTVIVDEASQCTLTNILPLIYRGQTLAVIGDDKQLPAIPTVREAEELSIAQKHGIEDHLLLLGHAGNNMYRSAVESLPRRKADIISLVEHFRSHPQIIGFSNRNIYQQRLELKKDPNWGKRLPIGSGVHVLEVSGFAQRGKNNRSWMNLQEADKVIAIAQQLKSGDSRSLKLGVVTPFVAQKEVIRGKLDGLDLSADVLVDTAYGFQGDEQDVIIFSPTVSKGITSHAALWVENPPNLVNVAITRAREAFYFVGDIDFCLTQRGILRRLALYCRQIQLLRQTSPAELDLYSWMLVKGWDPKVHPKIGDIEVDFTLNSRDGNRLVIEVDGQKYHDDTKEKDKARDAFLYAQGFEVFRTSARDVFETPHEVIHRIEQHLSGKSPLST